MPAFRNVSPRQLSQRLGESKPASSSQDGWKSSETILHHNLKVKVEVNDEQFDAPYGSPGSSLSSPSSCYLSAPSTPSDSVPSSAPHKTTRTRRRDAPDYIPRPRNAFIIFRSHYIKSRLGTSKEPQNELSKNAAVAWNTMSQADKAPFCQQACQEKDLHQAMYPDYVFSPVRNTSKKKRLSKKKATRAAGSMSSSYETSSESSSPTSSLHPPLPGCAYDEFLPTSTIPALELSPADNYDYSPQIPDFVPNFPPDLSPYQHHMPERFAFEQYQMGLQDPTLPLLPRSDTFALDELSYALPASTPAPNSLLCDNPYPSVDYLASAPSNFDLSCYSYLFDGQHPHFIQPEDEPVKNLQLTPLEDVGHTFFNANGEYTF